VRSRIAVVGSVASASLAITHAILGRLSKDGIESMVDSALCSESVALRFGAIFVLDFLRFNPWRVEKW
jgi:hypothetical protein